MESTKEYDFWQSEDSSINTVFKNVVLKNPNSIAIVDSEIILTYQELDELSNHLTGYLQSLDIDKNKPIAVYLNKSYHYIIACLAILKLGTAYLNIEIGYTSEFLIEILNELSPSTIITVSEFSGNVSSYSKPIIILDIDSNWINYEINESEILPVNSKSAAFIGFTSGTTGKPKGMIVSHKAMLYAFCKFWLEASSVSKNDVFGYLTYMSWDALSPLMFCKTGIILPDRLNSKFLLLVNSIFDFSINHIFLTPSMLKAVLDHVPKSILEVKMSKLRIIWLGGEIVTQELVNRVYELLPEIVLFNNYGPSECFVVSQGVLPKKDNYDELVCSTGKVLPEIDILILDNKMDKVELGDIGFLYVSGPCLIDGYINRPTLNKEKFLKFEGKVFYSTGDLAQLLTDNNLVIHGRENFIQQGGKSYNDLQKIQSSIKLIPTISDCVVVNSKDISGIYTTVAFITMKTHTQSNSDYINTINKIKSSFDSYTLPSRIIQIESVPINTVSQKIDYTKLLSLIK